MNGFVPDDCRPGEWAVTFLPGPRVCVRFEFRRHYLLVLARLAGEWA